MFDACRAVVSLAVNTLLCLVILVVPSRAEILDINILPANPAPGAEVTVVVDGYLYDLCWEVSGHSLSSSGNLFTVEIEAVDRWEPGLYCLQAVAPYAISYELSFLPAGSYAVRVVEHDMSMRYPSVKERHMCFSVGGINYACDCACYSDPGCSGATDVTDVVRAIGLAFRGSAPSSAPMCPWSEMDVNCSGVTDIVDVIGVVDVAFRGAPASSFCDPCTQ